MRKLLLLLSFLTLAISEGYAQSRILTGNVIDNASKPLDGVTVTVLESQKSTISDLNGNFRISAKNGETVRFSYVGAKSITMIVTAETKNLQVQFKDADNALNEVVVTGYTSERKKDLTGAVSVVNIKDIKNLPASSPLLALQGHVPGLYISTDGSPTGASNRQILIRGVNSLGNASPLYIIDGVPTTRYEDFSSLNINSISSIQVLKDASASSIYGSRASNGVIIVTTLDGRSSTGKDKVNISFNTSYTLQTVNPWEIPVLSSVQRGQALWRAAVNDKTDPNVVALPNIYSYNWNGDYTNPILNQVVVNPFVGGSQTEPVGNTNWQKALYKNSYITSNDLTIASGNDKSGLMIDFGYYNNSGLIVFTGYKRYNGRVNTHTSAFDGKLRVGENLMVSQSSEVTSTNDVGGASTPGLALTLAPTIPLYKTDGTYGGPIGSGYSDRNNPVDIQSLNKNNPTKQLIGFGNVYAEVEPVKHLVIRTSIGFDYSDSTKRTILLVGNEGPVRAVNSLALQDTKELTTTWTNTATYNAEFGKSKLNALIGTEAIKDDEQTLGAFRNNFALTDPSYFQLDAASGITTNNGSATGFRLLSQFAKVNYAYGSKYLASATVRRDGSSRFGTNNPYGVFPAGTIGWRLKEEDFLKDVKEITNLKLRAGYGKVGNQQIGNLASYGIYKANYGTIAAPLGTFPGGWINTGTAYDLTGVNTGTLPSGFVQVQAANPNLKWESTKELNIGVDFGLFNDKVAGSFDYFTRNTSDILIQPPVAGAEGEGQLEYLNGASKSNKGWEFTLNYNDRTSSGIGYSISADAGHFHDEVTQLPASVRAAYPGDINHTILGHSQFSFFGYKTDGIFQNQAEVNSSPTQPGAGPGRIKYADLNGDGKIDANDQEFLGTSLPGLEYGLNISLNYKNFDFSVFGSGVASKKVYDNTKFFNTFIDVRNNFGPGVFNAWTPQKPSSTTPALSLVNTNNEDRLSDFYIVNGDYFKLRNLQIGYSLPKAIANTLKIQNIRFYLLGQNLLIIKSKQYSGKDPEVGGNVNNVPIPTSATIGLNVTF